jgi:hypothetical protein
MQKVMSLHHAQQSGLRVRIDSSDCGFVPHQFKIRRHDLGDQFVK